MNIQSFKCRSCGSSAIRSILDLGETPLANGLLKEQDLASPEKTYPLQAVFCENCALVQITETVPPDELFSHYLYFSSNSDTMLKHAEELVSQVIDNYKLDGDSLAVEIASNDGYLLQYYVEKQISVLGIDPADNIAQVAENRGVPTLVEFFGTAVAKKLIEQDQYADVIHANNVLAHVADLNDVIAGMKLLLSPDGIIIIEAPYVKDLIDHVEFDTIYHEHLCYFSLTALNYLFEKHDLQIVDVERIAIHGGSLRVYAQHKDHGKQSQNVINLLDEEQTWGVHEFEFYSEFGNKVEELKRQLLNLLRDIKEQGYSIAAYGASAKGSTLLNYCDIGAEIIDFVADRSQAKKGYYTPGKHLPILGATALREFQPDYTLLLVWNFAQEVLLQQLDYRNAGGKFIIPVPRVKII